MHNYEDHGKTRGNASDGIKLEKEASTWAGLDPVCPLIHFSASRVLLCIPQS